MLINPHFGACSSTGEADVRRAERQHYWQLQDRPALAGALPHHRGHESSPLTRKIVVRYDHWLAEGGVSSNTRSCYLQSLRALYNRVGGSRRRMDLFAEVFTGNAPTPKRALSVAEIRRVRSLDMTGDWQRQLAQDVFCLVSMRWACPS